MPAGYPSSSCTTTGVGHSSRGVGALHVRVLRFWIRCRRCRFVASRLIGFRANIVPGDVGAQPVGCRGRDGAFARLRSRRDRDGRRARSSPAGDPGVQCRRTDRRWSDRRATWGGCQVCSGVLIASNVVLTARHCVAISFPERVRCGQATIGPSVPVERARRHHEAHDRQQRTRRRWAHHSVAEFTWFREADDACGFDLAALVLSDVVDRAEAVPMAPRFERRSPSEMLTARWARRDVPRFVARAMLHRVGDAKGASTRLRVQCAEGCSLSRSHPPNGKVSAGFARAIGPAPHRPVGSDHRNRGPRSVRRCGQTASKACTFALPPGSRSRRRRRGCRRIGARRSPEWTTAHDGGPMGRNERGGRPSRTVERRRDVGRRCDVLPAMDVATSSGCGCRAGGGVGSPSIFGWMGRLFVGRALRPRRAC